MPDETLELIRDKESELSALYNRMDKDRDAVYMNSYRLTGVGQFRDKEIPDTVSVTMNEPAVFANAIIAVLIGALRQTVVEGLSDRNNRLVERFLEDYYYTIDAELQLMQVASLWSWAANHVAIRGLVGARQTFDPDGRPNLLPVDMRYCPYQANRKGLVWAANHTIRTYGDIVDEYGSFSGLRKEKNYDVYDFWNDKVNKIFIGEEQQDQRPNVWGFVPFVIQVPPTGFMLRDENYMEHEGESIFSLNRFLYDEWNRLMSIQQTMAVKAVSPPYVNESDNPKGEPVPYVDKPGTVTTFAKGEIPKQLEMPDLVKASGTSRLDISSALQRGGVNNIDLGNVNQSTSAIWITEQQEIRNKILFPRLETLNRFYSQLSVMAIKEYIVMARTTKELPMIGRSGRRMQYTPEMLKDPDAYSITFKALTKSRKQELANWSLAVGIGNLASLDTKLRDIVQVEDPEGEIDKLKAEAAEAADPVIFFFNAASRLIQLAGKEAKKEDGDEQETRYRVEAKIMADRMVAQIHKQKIAEMGVIGQSERSPVPVNKPNSQALLAIPGLMGGGGGQMGVQNAKV